MSSQTANTTWGISKYQVQVNGTPFFANGVSYSPVPWGACTAFVPFGDFTIDTWSTVWQRDLALMRQNGVNTLKTYNTLDTAQIISGQLPPTTDQDHSDFLNACWNGGTQPIYVLMGYAPPKNQQSIFLTESWTNPANVTARQNIQADLVALATKWGSYPAVMGFVMANEINANNIINNPAFFQYWNGVAAAIVAAAPGKLTALANVDDSMATVNAGNQYMTASNFFWGINSYRGNWTNSNGFDVLFSTFATATSSNPRPLMITEWGAPASTHATPSGPMQDLSATQMAELCDYVQGHYNNMMANRSDTGSGVCCGGTYFEWTDEWWKADPVPCNNPGAAAAGCHTGVWDPGPSTTPQAGTFPGGWWDEEGFGLFAIAPVSPQTRVPVVPGGCVGPWDPTTNMPYPPDTLTRRAHAKALFKLFK